MGIALSISPSVTIFCEYLANGLDDFDNFLLAVFIWDDTKIFRFGPKAINGFSEGAQFQNY